MEQTQTLGFALYGLGNVQAGLGELREARKTAVQQWQLVENTSHEGMAHTAEGTATIELIAGEWNRAIEVINLAAAEGVPPFSEALMHFLKTQAYLGRGDLVAAVPMLEESLDKALAYRSKQVQLLVVTALGQAYLEAGKQECAAERVQEALAWADELGVPRAPILLLVGRVAMARGQMPQAHAYFDEALSFFVGGQQKPMEAHAHVSLASLKHATNDPSAARPHIETATALFVYMGAEWFASRTIELAGQLGIRLPADEGSVSS
jgi:tetratricopeptide (TPR) repeat protein